LKNARDQYDNNLLYPAIATENLNIIQYLLLIGLDKNHRNKYNQTPYIFAFKSQNMKIINMFTKDYEKDINNLEKTIDTYKTESIVLNNSLKRSYETMQTIQEENKNLRNDNDVLIIKNKKMKKTIDNLTNAMKK
jgi:ankyrin repeat protein